MKDILFTPIRLNELETLIQNSVERAMKAQDFKQVEPTEPVGSKKLYSIKELANFLQVSTVTAQRYKNDGLPCMQYGRKVCFDTEQVLNWLYNPKKRGTK